jgi:hypothetical protein
MTSIGWAPMLTRVTGEVVTAESLNRYAQNCAWLASQKSFGLAPFRTVRLAGDGTARFWFQHSGPTFHYRINVVGLDGGAWGIAVNGVTVKAASTDTGVRTTFGGGANETPVTLTGLTVGSAYEVQVIIGGTGGSSDVRIEVLYTTGVPAGYTWTALPTVTNSTVLTAANLDILRTDLEFLRASLDVPRNLCQGVIHQEEPYNDWTPGDSTEWRAGYHYAIHGDTETTFWEGYAYHQSDTVAFAVQGWVKTAAIADCEAEVKLYAAGNLVGTLTVKREGVNATPWAWASGYSGDVTIVWEDPATPTGAVTVYGVADISAAGLAENDWYRLHVTYEMETGGAGAWDTTAPPDRFDVSTWYVLEINGAIPTSFTAPGLWEPCDDWQGNGGGPNLTQITGALTDLYNRIPGWPNICVPQSGAPLFWQRRRRYLRYAPFGDVVAYGGDVTSVDATLPPTDVTLPDANPGYWDQADVPIGDLVVLRDGTTFYAMEVDL